jgi:hypothetical protein
MEATHHDTAMSLTVWIGLDVSKDTLDACLVKTEGRPLWKTFLNTPAGFQQLLRWVEHLVAEADCHFGLEATGAYSLGVAQFLAEANVYTSVLNPARVKYEGIAAGQGNKTDPADAHTMAQYCRLHHPLCGSRLYLKCAISIPSYVGSRACNRSRLRSRSVSSYSVIPRPWSSLSPGCSPMVCSRTGRSSIRNGGSNKRKRRLDNILSGITPRG